MKKLNQVLICGLGFMLMLVLVTTVILYNVEAMTLEEAQQAYIEAVANADLSDPNSPAYYGPTEYMNAIHAAAGKEYTPKVRGATTPITDKVETGQATEVDEEKGIKTSYNYKYEYDERGRRIKSIRTNIVETGPNGHYKEIDKIITCTDYVGNTTMESTILTVTIGSDDPSENGAIISVPIDRYINGKAKTRLIISTQDGIEGYKYVIKDDIDYDEDTGKEIGGKGVAEGSDQTDIKADVSDVGGNTEIIDDIISIVTSDNPADIFFLYDL